MDEVVIGSNGSKLVLAWAQRPVAGAETSLRAGLRVDGLSCDHDVYEFDGYVGLSVFFDGMNEAWRGWSGERVFTSLEHDLQITAAHAGSHVRLRVELAHSLASASGWQATAMIDIDAGEDLARAAQEVRELVGRG